VVCLVVNTKRVAFIEITGRKFLSFDGNFTMGLGMLFQKVKAAVTHQYFETTFTEVGHAEQRIMSLSCPTMQKACCNTV